MKKNILAILLAGVIGIFSSCEKDEDKITILENIVAPELTTIPSAAELLLKRDNSDDTLTFAGTHTNAGFSTSSKYILEACASLYTIPEEHTLLMLDSRIKLRSWLYPIFKLASCTCSTYVPKKIPVKYPYSTSAA